MTAEVVEQWGKEFDIDALVAEEKKDLSGECERVLLRSRPLGCTFNLKVFS